MSCHKNKTNKKNIWVPANSDTFQGHRRNVAIAVNVGVASKIVKLE